jgi:GxxExxY protein
MSDPLREIQDACIDVYAALGPGHSEVTYHKALEVEFRARQIPYESEKVVPIVYKEHTIGYFRLDFVVRSNVIVELKAMACNLRPEERMQLANYQKVLSLQDGLLVNFRQKQDADVEFISTKGIGQ